MRLFCSGSDGRGVLQHAGLLQGSNALVCFFQWFRWERSTSTRETTTRHWRCWAGDMGLSQLALVILTSCVFFSVVQMGEEYFHARDYHKALTLLSRVTWDYRNERWWGLLTNILTMSLRCAYLVASIQEYVTISLELIGKCILAITSQCFTICILSMYIVWLVCSVGTIIDYNR